MLGLQGDEGGNEQQNILENNNNLNRSIAIAKAISTEQDLQPDHIKHTITKPTPPKKILSFEILLMISSFIDNPLTLINWIKALQLEKYPTLNDLPLIPLFAEKAEIETVDLWPMLVIRSSRLDYQQTTLLGRISYLFTTIRFMDWLDIDLINQGVTSNKPSVELNMSDRSTADMKILAASIPNSRVNKLHLEGVTDKKIELICDALIKTPSPILTDIEIYGILTIKSMSNFATMLTSSSIKVLKLNGRLDEESLCALAKSFPSTKLKELVLTECSISTESAHQLCLGISDSQIRDLFLDDNDLDDEGAVLLAPCLAKSPLTILNLSDSCLSSRGVMAFSAFLPESSVTEFDFYGNSDVDMDALIHLAEVLPKSKVVDLGMGSINLDLPGMISVARILRTTPITNLNISYNTLTLEMVQTLVSSLPFSKLTNLNLCGCSLTPEGCQLVLEALVLSPITVLDMSENDMKGKLASLLTCIKESHLKSLFLTESNLGLAEISRLIRECKGKGVDVETDFPRLLGDRLRRDDCSSLISTLAAFLGDDYL